MKHYLYLAFVVLMASCDSNDSNPKIVKNIDPLLISVDVKGALALTFGYEGSETRLQTIDANKNIGQPKLTFQGESQGLEKDFYLCDIDSSYYLLVAPTFKQNYFVNKKTGAAKQSAFFPIDYLNTSKIACHDSTCYFIDTNYKLYRLTNFLSTAAKFEPVTSISFSMTIDNDVDGMYYIESDTGTLLFDEEKLTNVPLHAGFWKGRDGHMRIIGTDGKISKYTTGTLTYEQSLPYTVTSLAAINFPQYETTVGFQYKYNLLMFFELESPYATATPSAPSMSEDVKPFFQILRTGYGKYFYLLYGLPNKSKELRKLDVTTFTSTTSTVTTTFNSCSAFVALREDVIMTVICQNPDGCRDELAFLNSDGSFTFPEFWGQASIRYVTF